MTPRVGRPPRVNPFSTRFVQPGAVPFLVPTGGSVADLARRLDALGGWGQIVGPHGSGKSTFLAALLPHLTAWTVRPVRLNATSRVLPAGVWAEPTGRTLLVIDGFEQLGFRTRWRVKRHCRRSGTGLLVTAHRSMGLPTLHRTDVTVETAVWVVDRLLTPADRGVLDGYDVPARLRALRGSLRDVLFELYDRWERTR